MDSIGVKIFLIKKGINLSDVARELREEEQTEQSVRVMLSQMIHGRRWYPSLAKKLEERYGIRLTQPKRSAA